MEIGIWPGPGRIQRWPLTETSFYQLKTTNLPIYQLKTINWSFNNQKKWLSLPGWEFLNGSLSDRGPTDFAGFLVLKSPHPRKPISSGQIKDDQSPLNPKNPDSLECIQTHSLPNLFLDLLPGLMSHHALHLILQWHGRKHGTLKPPSRLLYLRYFPS